MTQEQAEKFLEAQRGFAGLDMNTHSWEVQAHGVMYRAVELLPGQDVWGIVIYYYDVIRADPDWVKVGIIHSFNEFKGSRIPLMPSEREVWRNLGRAY